MRANYFITLSGPDGAYRIEYPHATLYQVDKVFYALSLTISGTDYDSVTLYVRSRSTIVRLKESRRCGK